MKLYKKIDIYSRYGNSLTYLATTEQAKTCKEAVKAYAEKNACNPEFLRAYKNTGR